MRAIIFVESNLNEKHVPDSSGSFYPPLIQLKNEETVFERQIRILGDFGITDFTVIADRLIVKLETLTQRKEFQNFKFTWVKNSKYKILDKDFSIFIPEKNNNEPIIVIAGNLITSKQVIQQLFEIQNDSAVVVEPVEEFSEDYSNDFHVNGTLKQALQDAATFNNNYMVHPVYMLSRGKENLLDAKLLLCNSDHIYQIKDDEDSENAIDLASSIDFLEQPFYDDFYAIFKTKDILLQNQVNKLMVVSDRLNEYGFIKEYFSNLSFTVTYIESCSDSIVEQEAIRYAGYMKNEKAFDFIISFGNDESINTGKCIVSQARKQGIKNIKHLAIPDHKGLESAATDTVRINHNQALQVLKQDTSLPDYVILESKIIEVLSVEEKISIVLEIICSCIDVLWKTEKLKKEGIVEKALLLTLDNMFGFLDRDIEAARRVMNAKFYSAKAVHMLGTTPVYDFGYHISNIFGIRFGSALAISSPYFWSFYANNIPKCRVMGGRKYLAEAVEKIKSILKIDSNAELLEIFRFITTNVMQINLPEVDKDKLEQLKSKAMWSNFEKNSPVYINREDYKQIVSAVLQNKGIHYENFETDLSIYVGSWQAYVDIWKESLLESVRIELRQTRLEILEIVDSICRQNGYTYFLSYGTLLGAVRHQGFIPWNDNIDILMPRKDYNLLVDDTVKKLPENYYVHSSYNDEYFWSKSARVCKKNTFIERKQDINFYASEKGINIDVWPLNYARKNKGFIMTLQFQIIHLLDLVIQCRLSPGFRDLGWKGQVLLKLSSLLSFRTIRNIQRKLLIMDQNENVPYFALRSKHSNQTFFCPEEWFLPAERLRFEDKTYPVPRNWDLILKSLYGDYKKIPPPDEQTIRRPVKVSFNTSQDYFHFTQLPANYKSSKGVKAYNLYTKILRITINVFRKILKQPAIHSFKRLLIRIGGFFRCHGVILSHDNRRLADYRNRYYGKRCFLIGNGPSLKAEDLELLRDEFSFGCNLIYKIFNQTNWRPTFYCISDSNVTRSQSHKIVDSLGDNITLFVREFAFRYMQKRPMDAIRLPYLSTGQYKVRGDILAYHYTANATVMTMMMELAFYMGFNEIYLIGVDNSSSSKKGSHFTNNYYLPEEKTAIRSRIRRVDPYRSFKERAQYFQNRAVDVFTQLKVHADKKNIKIYNATRGGNLEVFDRVNLDSLFSNNKNTVN